jgi:hypothetical protein
VVLDGRQNLRPDSAVIERARPAGAAPAARGASGAASASAGRAKAVPS